MKKKLAKENFYPIGGEPKTQLEKSPVWIKRLRSIACFRR